MIQDGQNGSEGAPYRDGLPMQAPSPDGLGHSAGIPSADEMAFDNLMDDISTVYSLRPGHTLTQADFDAIQRFDEHFRSEENNAIDAFHKGYTQGLREGGSADIEQMQARLDGKQTLLAVEKALRHWAEVRLTETEQHVSDFIRALDRGYLDCKDDSVFIDALRTIATRSAKAIEARSDKTGTGLAEGESAAPQGFAQTQSGAD